MSDRPAQPDDHDDWQWEYPPPPTIYDLVRDSFLMRTARLAVHLCYRTSMRRWHRLRVTGVRHVLDNWPCLITPNHASHLDTLAVFASHPIHQINHTCSAAAKDYFFKNRFTSLVGRLFANVLPLDRRKGKGRQGMQLCARKLRGGFSIIFFPEGTRSGTGEIGSFKSGAAMLGRELKVPIIPACIRGTIESLPKWRKLPTGEHVSITYGEPVRFWEGEPADLDHKAAAGYLEARVRELKQRACASAADGVR